MTLTSTSENSTKTKPKQVPGKLPFPVVGIGASAGGLEALEEFFQAIPVDSGVAFIVVTHLDPNHVSLLPDLLARKTAIRVEIAQDGTRIQANSAYVIPPKKEMAIFNGTLQLLDIAESRQHKLLIDSFLHSLAQDQGDMAISIILSGTGTDGTLGIRAIKGEAGMTMAQDIVSAKYDGMPKSAIATGLIDFVLPPAQMPEQLIKYIRHQHCTKHKAPFISQEEIETSMQKIFMLLRTATNHDFSLYKKNTICRRIERRMHVQQIDKLDDYVRFLQDSTNEVTILFKELLIGVTSFFRDPEAFELLKNIYLPELLKKKPDNYQIRIWVPGCSTGEEAYSIAILIAECMQNIGRRFDVQIFGTDLDENAIDTARIGCYPESISSDVSPERLKSSFIKKDDIYQIKKSLREMIIFAPQNIIKDPPFTKLDMLCCRNLLIYFGPELQKKLIPMFHYSLKKDGILFTGSSETIGQAQDLFNPLDKKWKIFERVSANLSAQSVMEFPTSRIIAPSPMKKMQNIRKLQSDTNASKLLKTLLAQSDMPACVIIDDTATILYVHGHTGPFLELAEGEANYNLLAMAKPGLKSALSNAIRTAEIDGTEHKVKDISLDDDDEENEKVNLIVRPLPDAEINHRRLLLVIFEKIFTAVAHGTVTTSRLAKQKKTRDIKRLEKKLQFTRETLQTTIEELETSNEELKSTNEELQSTNEELQSTNEELETSKEELQSLNEESVTVNVELQSRIDELVAAHDDIKNFLEATEIATVFLDIDFNIRRFTSKVTEIFPLTTTDVGRPIRHFASNLENVDLQLYAEKVLEDLEKRSVEVNDNDGKIFLMKVRPYRTMNNVIDGVIITFEDITELRVLLESAKRLATVVEDSNDAITLQDLEGNIIAWNKGAERLYGFSESEALKMNIKDITSNEKQIDIKSLTNSTKEDNVESLVTERINKSGETVQVWLTITKILDDMGNPKYIATTERDMSKINM